MWDQPLDYVHYRERADRRPLHAFLATWVLEASEPADVVDRFRLAVYRARFDRPAATDRAAVLAEAADISDISDTALLVRLATEAGADGARLRDVFASPAEQAAARADLATAWADARSEYEIFGVPTIEWPGATPFYLRLERQISPGDEALDLLKRLVSLRGGAPYDLDIKLPEHIRG